MIGLAIALSTLGLADLLAGGLAGTPTKLWRVVAAIGVSGFGAALVAWRLDVSHWAEPALIGVALGLTWQCLRLQTTSGEPIPEEGQGRLASRSLAAIGVVLAGIAGMILLSPRWAAEAPRVASLWAALPFPLTERLTAEQALLAGAVLLALAATANGFVRATLHASGTHPTNDGWLRAGRTIGIVERYLIFGLALVGEPTAAALVISAKSILRFPEVSRGHREAGLERSGGADEITEFFVLGSLVSWAIALAPVLFF